MLNTDGLREQIRAGVAREEETNRLRMLVRMRWMGMGIAPGEIEERVDGTMAFVRRYVETVPEMLEAVIAAAEEPGVVAEVVRASEAAEQYFHETVDFIPDHLGLIGLIDDAYLAHSLMQAISNAHRDRRGRPLLPIDFSRANEAIRSMIGEPVASKLDRAITGVLHVNEIRSTVDRLSELVEQLAMSMDDPYADDPAMREPLEMRLGALG